MLVIWPNVAALLMLTAGVAKGVWRTFNGNLSLNPLWMPDGKHIVFNQGAASEYAIWWIRADGSGQPEKLYSTKYALMASSVFPDGRRVAFSQQDPSTGMDLWALSLDLSGPDHPKAAKPELFLRGPADQVEPAFSPDGHWIAYTSLDSGSRIFVRPFPGGNAGKWQISTAPGRFPSWARNGRELFYMGGGAGHHIMVAAYTAKAIRSLPISRASGRRLRSAGRDFTGAWTSRPTASASSSFRGTLQATIRAWCM